MKMTNKVFDILKWFAILFLPALAVFVQTVFPAWNLPYANEIALTIEALHVFLGACLGISHIQYKAEKELGPE